MNFSTNQVRHLYVLVRENASMDTKSPSTPLALGDYKVKAFSINGGLDDNAVELLYNGHGGLTHSDIIRCKNIRKINVTPASAMERKLCQYKIQFDTYTPLANEATRYMYLNFDFPGFASITPEETFTKTVQFEASTTAATTAQNCANAINTAFAGEFAEFVNATVSSDTVTITAVAPTRHTATAGLFEIAGTNFVLSNFTQEAVMTNGIIFHIEAPYAVEGTSLAAGKWINNTNDASNTNIIKNNAIIRDLEIFCMGDRGDNYRMKGWPNFVPTSYMINSDAGDGYDVLDVHYYYQGEGTNDDKSEKVLTLVMAHTDNSIDTLNAIKAIFNS